MAETDIPITTPPDKWSTSGLALSFQALDMANGNSFDAKNDLLLIVRNTDASAQTFQITSEPYPPSDRTGDINQALAAGEERVFRLTRTGWENDEKKIVIPDGQSSALEVVVLNISS